MCQSDYKDYTQFYRDTSLVRNLCIEEEDFHTDSEVRYEGAFSRRGLNQIKLVRSPRRQDGRCHNFLAPGKIRRGGDI